MTASTIFYIKCYDNRLMRPQYYSSIRDAYLATIVYCLTPASRYARFIGSGEPWEWMFSSWSVAR